MTSVTEVTCPRCGSLVAARKDGLPKAHKRMWLRFNAAPGRMFVEKPCR